VKRIIGLSFLLICGFFISCERENVNIVNDYESKIESKICEDLSSSVVIIFGNHGEIKGSGIVWDNNYIVTNHHVIKGMDKVYIKFENNDKFYECMIVGAVSSKDTAVLRIFNPPKLMNVVSLNKKNDLHRGDEVIVIGHPMGLDHSVSKGIISSIREDFQTSVSNSDVIQVDCALNPGNSGGAIFDTDGYLIGMSSFIISKSGMSHGLNFGVHIDEVKDAVDDILHSEDSEDILRGRELYSMSNIVEFWDKK
jgi:2-alkenal reductase